MLLRYNFKNANFAFEVLYNYILNYGDTLEDTRYISNVGFYLHNPLDNEIKVPWRKWNKDYAETEWQWYLSQDRSVENIKKMAPIWDKMHNGDNIVNSNYGYQWNRSGQIDFVVNELIERPTSRRAVITIYDGKEHELHKKDTPCTLSIAFSISHNLLDMSVMMRSNDLWYGFCNDQYCFSKLQQMVSDRLGISVGRYFHFIVNMHLYKSKFLKMKEHYERQDELRRV